MPKWLPCMTTLLNRDFGMQKNGPHGIRFRSHEGAQFLWRAASRRRRELRKVFPERGAFQRQIQIPDEPRDDIGRGASASHDPMSKSGTPASIMVGTSGR